MDAVESQPRVRAVGIETKKLHGDKRFQDGPAGLRVNTAEPTHLFDPEPHPWHFEELGSDPFKNLMIDLSRHSGERPVVFGLPAARQNAGLCKVCWIA